MKQRCVTCNADLSTVDSSVKFTCPACGENEVGRCGKCRRSTKAWKCGCGFEGP